MASIIKVDKIAQASGTPEFTIPTADGTAKSALITDGSGVLSFATGTPSSSNFLRGDGTWQTVTTTALTGSTNTWIPTITAANALTGTANFTYDGNILDVKNSGTASSIKLYCESSNAHYQAIKAAPHAGSSDWTLTLPGVVPTVSGQALTATTAGVSSWTTIASGITQAQQWRVTADFAISTSTLYVYANWEKPEATRFPGSLGSDMAVDSTASATLSGAWTFPESGTWLVRWNFFNEGVGGSQSLYSRILATDDNGASWVEVAKNDSYGFHNQDVTVTNEYMFNVDDTTTDKIRFSCVAAGYGMVIRGDTNANAHYATFMRLGDKS